ncbi:CocE/NonD family hydrolase [Williamsia sp. D3]|uniref:CocE/NonD family hydrolase n=1 Tax=Williamsia sp. D3 TaxID=1313067 RepID=UPI0009DF2D1D
MTCSLTETQVDGLHTNVFLPDTAPRSVLIIRTPYDAGAYRAEAHAWVRRGIGVVTQDVRGRHRSRGRFRPFENEGADGLATLQWVASRSWAGAPVILYGTSYSAHCAVETAIAAAEAGVDAVGGVSVAVPALGSVRRHATSMDASTCSRGWAGGSNTVKDPNRPAPQSLTACSTRCR